MTTLTKADDVPLFDSRREWLLVVGCIVLYALGNMTGWLASQIFAGSMARFGVSAARAGFLGVAEGITAGVLSALLARRAPRLSYRSLAFAAVLLSVAVNAGSFFAPTFYVFLGLRFLSGVASGTMVFAAVAAAALSRRPERSYSFMNTAANLYAAAVLALWPMLTSEPPTLSYLPFVAVLALVLAPIAFTLPRSSPGRVVSRQCSGASSRAPITRRFVVLLVIVALYCLQSFAVFTFSIPLGSKAGLSPAEIGVALGTASLASCAGPFLATLAFNYWGRFWPVFAVTLLLSCMNYILVETHNAAPFRLAMVVEMTSVYFLLPLFQGWAAAFDPSGRSGGALMGVFFVGGGVAATLIGKLVDMTSIAVFIPVIITTGLAMQILLLLLGDNAVPAAAQSS